jgi:hypothetical protein
MHVAVPNPSLRDFVEFAQVNLDRSGLFDVAPNGLGRKTSIILVARDEWGCVLSFEIVKGLERGKPQISPLSPALTPAAAGIWVLDAARAATPFGQWHPSFVFLAGDSVSRVFTALACRATHCFHQEAVAAFRKTRRCQDGVSDEEELHVLGRHHEKSPSPCSYGPCVGVLLNELTA